MDQHVLDEHAINKPARRDAVGAAIADAAADCGISLVASLPDGWITPLIARFDADACFRHVAVNREESAIGLCSGAFFSGIVALALMGASSFFRFGRYLERTGGAPIFDAPLHRT